MEGDFTYKYQNRTTSLNFKTVKKNHKLRLKLPGGVFQNSC